MIRMKRIGVLFLVRLFVKHNTNHSESRMLYQLKQSVVKSLVPAFITQDSERTSTIDDVRTMNNYGIIRTLSEQRILEFFEFMNKSEIVLGLPKPNTQQS